MTQKLLPAPKVLIVSNQHTTGMLWVFGLREQKFDVSFEPIVAKATERCAETNPDLIILDINYSQQATIQLIKSLREEAIAPIILLTRNMTEDDLLEAYAAGADDCIFKPLSPSIFLAKIRVWLRHSRTVPTETRDSLKTGIFSLIPATRTLIIGEDGAPIHLTNLELRLFYYLMSRPSRSVPAGELIHAVWGYTAEGDHTTLKNLVYRLRRKIEANPAGPLFIQTVTGGYMLVADK